MKPRKQMYMPQGCLYLNNDGSRWITNDMRFVLVLPDGKRKVRRADWYESFGNFAIISYRHKGRRYTGLPKAFDGTETRPDGVNPESPNYLQHVFQKEEK